MQIWLLLVMNGHGGGVTVAQDDFQLAAKQAEAAYSPAEWLAIGQRGRSAAIYKELREIDRQAAERLATKIETGRRHVRDDEARVARPEAIVAELGTHQDALSTMGDTRDLAKQHLPQVES